MKTFKEYIIEAEIINESLSNELMYLKRYLNISNEDKTINRAYSNPWDIDNFLCQIDYDENPEFENMEDFETIEWLDNNDKSTLIKYGEYILNSASYINSSEQELYDVVDYRGFVRNKWLVHFSNNAYDIWKEQEFKYGISYGDYSRLALSTHFTNQEKEYGGFNFAYELYDVNRYAFNGRRPKYGEEAVLFLGNGIKIYHYGDEEPQVIFDGKMIRPPIIHIEFIYDEWVIKSTITGNKLITFDNIESIGNWVNKNYQQYRKHLEPK